MTGVRMLCTRCGMVGLFIRGRCPTCEPETEKSQPISDNDTTTKEQRLQQVAAELPELARERDDLIRELMAAGGYGTGAKLARLTGLTRMRIHQIAKG